MKIFSTLRLTALTSVLLASQPLAAADRFADVNITTQQVTENVYMLQGAGGNIGVSSGTDGTLIIDDQFASLAGKMESALRELGGDRPRIVRSEDLLDRASPRLTCSGHVAPRLEYGSLSGELACVREQRCWASRVAAEDILARRETAVP